MHSFTLALIAAAKTEAARRREAAKQAQLAATNALNAVSQGVRNLFDSIPDFRPIRKRGWTTAEERDAFQFFYSNGIRREEIAAKFGIGFATVYTFTFDNQAKTRRKYRAHAK